MPSPFARCVVLRNGQSYGIFIPMTKIIEKLKTDLVVSMKAAKQAVVGSAEQKAQEGRKVVLRSVIGAIQTAEKSGKTPVEFTDEQVVTLLTSEVKKRRDTAAIYAGAGEQDRADVELAEVAVITEYLPTQLTRDEVAAIVSGVVSGMDKPVFGMVMKNVTAQTKGRADGKMVSEIVKEALAG